MNTEDNLKEAFAGESQAYMSYHAYARAAEKEGHKQIARLFRAVAEAEKIHALAHFGVMGKSTTTDKNLEAAIEGETYEFTQMYPAFIDKAKSESNKRAQVSFGNASEVEKIHSVLYKEALDNLGKNEETFYYVCPICGNTHAGDVPGKCDICGVAGDRFIRIE
ncbi:MAG: rubrerythrin family protein [candidate division Zixibacteria bacterium]